MSIRLNDLPDDGAAGEGDNVLGSLGGILGGSGDDTLESGPDAAGLVGGAGDDTLVGSPEGESLLGQEGNDDIAAGGGRDSLEGGPGADRLSGGPGRDEASYAGEQRTLRLSIGDGPGDGAEGEGDDILEDVEDLIGGRGTDVIIGDADANRLVASGGADMLFGGAGADTLGGWDDGDRLDAGSGTDRVRAAASDLPLLDDGERDRADCNSSAPVIEADSLDTFRSCAPRPSMRPLGRLRRGQPVRLALRCPAPSAVPCSGRFVVRLIRGRRVSRTVRFGPIPPEGRAVLGVGLLRALGSDALIRATGVSPPGTTTFRVPRAGAPGSRRLRAYPQARVGNVAGVSDSDSFGARSTLEVGGESYEIFRLDALQEKYDVTRLPYALKVLLENLLRNGEDEGAEAVARWAAGDEPSQEIAYRPARVLMQDFTGVPAIVDLAAMRDAMEELGGDATRINPLVPVELVIDHSIQVDVFAERLAFQRNAEFEFERNKERYAFLRWGQTAFDNFMVVPPNTGICHQVNLEYLGRVVESREGQAFPDTLVGTDSHTTMINGLGVLGWGVGGIEAEAAMLGQPVSMLVPQVVGFRLSGELPEGSTATDLVLTVTEMLRERGVVGKFVEFWGPGLPNLPLADRATIGNMAPEMGATCAIFPVDAETLRYLEFSGRPAERIELVEAYCREQGLFHDEDSEEATYSDTLELDLGEVEPSLAGPKRPQDRVALSDAAADFRAELEEYTGNEVLTGYDEAIAESFPTSDPPTKDGGGQEPKVGHSHPKPGTAVAEREEGFGHGSVVIAAITSCTNTSNPSVMIGAGLLAKKAVEAGLERMPWVKTSLAPGSKVVTEYLERADLIEPLSRLGFDLVGYGCTTCIGNSGPLPEEVSKEIEERELVVASVLSGNRNFEGRIHPEVKMNYLASPPLCVAYALAGRMDLDITREPLQNDVYLRDIWPTQREVNETIESAIESDMFRRSYGDALFEGDDNWKALEIPEGDRYAWDEQSTYVKQPPYFADMPAEAPEGFEQIEGARAIAVLGDSVTTDHISPAGAIKKDSPAGEYLIEHGVEPREFNSYGSRRGNHEVMMRGTFANIRLRNQLAPGTEGGFTTKDGEVKPIYDAAMEYHEEGTPLCVIAGKEYGSGSSRDWAAKGPRLLGVRFVIAESYERIHRSNLVGMGVLPLQFPDGESAESLGLTGEESFDLAPLEEGAKTLKVSTSEGVEFDARVRIDTPNEWLYYRHDGILHFVLRDLLQR